MLGNDENFGIEWLHDVALAEQLYEDCWACATVQECSPRFLALLKIF